MVQLDLYIDENFTRLAVPSDYDNNKLYPWNQKQQYGIGEGYKNNPWSTQYYTIIGGMVGRTLINSGSLVTIHLANAYATEVTDTEIHETANNFNWSHDKTNHRFSFEFYLDNDLEETNPTEIYDDDETFWTLYNYGSGSYQWTLSEELTEKKKGSSSAKMQRSAGSSAGFYIQHEYGSPQDWSLQEFICLWIYGANSGTLMYINIDTNDGLFLTYFHKEFLDNWTGWKRLVIPLNSFTIGNGSPSWSTVKVIRLFDNTGLGELYYLDRIVIDVGQLVKVETFVPDKLSDSQRNVRLYSWTGSAWSSAFLTFDAEDNNPSISVVEANLYFLDGTQGSIIPYSVDGFLKGERGQTKTGLSWATQTITYSSYYGCKKRIGFILKLPPHDGLGSEAGGDSSTTGISQCKLKLEIYYDIVEDTSGQGNHGTRYDGSTPNAGPTSVDGKYGKGLDFDGLDDKITVEDNSSINFTSQDFTISFWIKARDLLSLQRIFYKAIWGTSGYIITLYEGYLIFYTFHQGIPEQTRSNVLPSANTWLHIALVRDGSVATFYFNGVDQTYSHETHVDPASCSESLKIGIHGDGASDPFNGVLDEIRFYNRALSVEEIQESMKGGNHVTRNGLVGEWKMEFGRATYEFENSTNTYYGLQNIQPPSGHTLTWSCLFNPTTSQYDYYIHDIPIGLEITADENEKINKISLVFNSGSSIIKRGKKCGPYLSQDKDSDNIPNVFDEQESFLPE